LSFCPVDKGVTIGWWVAMRLDGCYESYFCVEISFVANKIQYEPDFLSIIKSF